MRPVRRAGWVWAARFAPAAKKMHGLGVRAQVRRISIPLSHSRLRRFPRSCLPRIARRGAARGSAIQDLVKVGALSRSLCSGKSLFRSLQRRHTKESRIQMFPVIEFLNPLIGQPLTRRESTSETFELWHIGSWQNAHAPVVWPSS